MTKLSKVAFLNAFILFLTLLFADKPVNAQEKDYSFAVIINPVGLVFGVFGLNLEFQKVKIAGANPGIGAGFASWWTASAYAFDIYLRWFLDKEMKNAGLNVKAGVNPWIVTWSGGNTFGFSVYGVGGYRFVFDPKGRFFIDLGIGVGFWNVRWGTWSVAGIRPVIEGALGIKF